MTFLVQFLRFRRGVPEVIGTHQLPAASAAEALEIAKTRVGAGSWPVRTEALRVMDDGGRMLADWLVPESQPSPAVDTLRFAAQQRMAAELFVRPRRNASPLHTRRNPGEGLSTLGGSAAQFRSPARAQAKEHSMFENNEPVRRP